jgi:hypothetical protein
MQTIDNDKEKLHIATEQGHHIALDLICKKGYTFDATAKELKIDRSDLKIRIRKELCKYREYKK